MQELGVVVLFPRGWVREGSVWACSYPPNPRSSPGQVQVLEAGTAEGRDEGHKLVPENSWSVTHKAFLDHLEMAVEWDLFNQNL